MTSAAHRRRAIAVCVLFCVLAALSVWTLRSAAPPAGPRSASADVLEVSSIEPAIGPAGPSALGRPLLDSAAPHRAAQPAPARAGSPQPPTPLLRTSGQLDAWLLERGPPAHS